MGERAEPTERHVEVSGPPCPFCEAGMEKRHCKYVCPQHGVVYDCSDPFR
ncbi:HVO_2523 family zinc finger protein [Halovivax gelatinilyticus]|nr:HVO_2523 family zinc finger protein [Halovivax gelatinilyticus]